MSNSEGIEGQVSLYVESKSMSCESMLKLLRAVSEQSWSVGENRTNHVGQHDTNGVCISPAVAEDASFEVKLAAMTEMLEGADFEAFRSESKSLNGEFRIGLDLYSDEGYSFVLPRSFISVARKLLIPIDIDVLYFTESEESSTPYQSRVCLSATNAGETVVLGRQTGLEAVGFLLTHTALLWSGKKDIQYDNCILCIVGERPIIDLPTCFLKVCNDMCREFDVIVKAR
ncbi:MAG: hypothetical protein K6G91_05520 [Kiritimatiellae bacterium]|nr:hypothetical protein [Kiritimatiellia bacterium]